MSVFRALQQPVSRPRAGRKWRRALVWLFMLGLLGGLLVLGINWRVLQVGRARIVSADQARPADAIVVLGALVYADGSVSPIVRDRLETAYALYKAGKAPKILITGDHGQTSYDEVNTMRKYLEKKGVPPEDIFMDHAGFNTYDSMYRARAVFEVHSALVVTQAFHLPRAVYLSTQMGIVSQGVTADRVVYSDARYNELREMGARVKAFLEATVHPKPTFLGPVIPIAGDGRATRD